MKNFILFFFVTLLIAACNWKSGSGNIISEKRNVASFHGIKASQGFEVEVRLGEIQELTIEADDNFMGDVKTTVKNGILSITLDEHNVNDAHLKAYVTAISIDDLKTSSAASIIVKDELFADGEINLEASSGSKITTSVNAPSVHAKTSSGSDINLRGRTKIFVAKASSGSSIKASELLSENTKASGSSGSSVYVHASVSLDASASSGANISYRGGANVEKSVSSGGGVSKE